MLQICEHNVKDQDVFGVFFHAQKVIKILRKKNDET